MSLATAAAPHLNLKEKIESRQARVGIIGMGYVGLPLALLYDAESFPVTGFDIDAGKTNALNRGESYIAHIAGNDIAGARKHGFSATTDFSRIADMDAIIICVPTPLDEHGGPDISCITQTAHSMAPHLRAGQLIVLESSTYPGTTEEVLAPVLERHNRLNLRVERFAPECEDDGRQPSGTGKKQEGIDDCAKQSQDPVAFNAESFYLAYSPEREDPGRTDISRVDVPKVVGGLGPVAAELAGALYGTIFRKVVRVSSPAAAEMCKLLENIYRCVNIAMVNELKLLCQRMGIDIWEVIEAASSKPFGFQPFFPGPGLGGHCIPIDPFYLSWKAREYDFRTRFIELAGEINTQMPYHVLASVSRELSRRGKCLNGARVLVLGVAYKKDVDDLRESPSLTLIELLQKQGAAVSYHDPYFPFLGQGRHYKLNMHCASLDNLWEYDCVLIATDHSIYDYQRIVRESQLVVDTRNATRGISSPAIVRC